MKMKIAFHIPTDKEANPQPQDPIWLEGFEDGIAPGAGSTPDMRRGHTYVSGWLTGKLSMPLPSLRVH
jgi:hypothetical protein